MIIQSSPIAMGLNTFIYMLASYMICMLVNMCGMGFLTSWIWLAISDDLINLYDRTRLRIWKAVGFTLLFTGNAIAIVPLAMFLMCLEQDLVPNQLVKSLALGIESRVESWLLLDNWEIRVGANNVSWWNALLEEIRLIIRGVQTIIERGQLSWTIVTRAQRVRSNGINPDLEVYETGPPLDPKAVISMEKVVVGHNKMTIVIVVAAVAFVLKSTPMGFVMFLSAVFIYTWQDMVDKYQLMGTENTPIQEGSYLITRELFGHVFSKCMGVSYAGVLHAPYHGAHRNDIIIGGRLVKPYFVSVDCDLITWGGMPSFATLTADDRVVVNHEDEIERRSMLVDYKYDDEIDSFSWAGKSKPGQSGSGVWKVTEEGEIQIISLVGLVGRWARCEGLVTEVAVRPTIDVNAFDLSDPFKRIVMHPGAGKTFKVIPSVVHKYLSEGRKGKVMIVGPTRVVCQELYNSLVRKFPCVGLSMKNNTRHRKPTARIQITTHHTFLRMIQNASIEVANLGLLILDEAHVEGVATRLCVKYAENLSKSGGRAVLLSATFDDTHSEGSNFTITDKHINSGDEISIVKSKVNDGKRVLWFVPGYHGKNGAKEMADRLMRDGIQAIAVGRPSYTDYASRLNDTTVRVVVATNIAECGMNIDCDVVVNTATEFDYFSFDNIVTGETRTIGHSSWIQRRGRCGRTKVGEHYYTAKPVENHKDKATAEDMRMLLAGRSWAGNLDVESNIQLSDEQFDIWLEKDLPPRVILLLYDARGNKLHGRALEASMQAWTRGGTLQTVCGCGKCPAKCHWLDMRAHNILAAAREGNSQIHLPLEF